MGTPYPTTLNEMVKRKADINLEKWLAKGTVAPEASSNAASVPKAEPAQADSPTAEVVAKRVALPTPVADVANQGEGDSDWFWSILEQSGYERW